LLQMRNRMSTPCVISYQIARNKRKENTTAYCVNIVVHVPE
jgi:hypothetical protein